MATEIKKVINIETGTGERSVKSLKKEISDLKDALLNVEKGSQEWEEITKKLVQAQADLKAVTDAGKTSIDAATDSIVGMEREYKSLYDTYKLLTEEQRNSDFGKNMAASLEQLSAKLNETKQSVGNFKDNIGHYTQSTMDAFNQLGVSVGALAGPMKVATATSKGLGATLKALAANPVGAAIMTIVLAFKALSAIADRVRKAIQGNEEHTQNLHKAMAAFRPIVDGVSNAFDKLAGVVVKVVGVIGNVFNAIRKAGAAFTDFLHITNGAKQRVDEQIKSYSELAKAQNEYTKNLREAQVLNSAESAEVERLRNEAAAISDKTEKAEKLNEAIEVQNRINERNIALAEENLRILQEEAAKTANDAEANERLAQAQIAVNNARAQAEAAIRPLQQQVTNLTKAQESHNSEIEKEKDKLKELLKAIDANSKTEIQKLKEKYEEEKKLMEKYHKDTTELTKQYNKQINEIERQAAAARIKTQMDAVDLYIDTFIKPSTAAYDEMIFNQREKFENFAESIKKTGVKLSDDLRLITDSKDLKLFTENENGVKELTDEIKNLNDVYGLNIELSDDIESVDLKLGAALRKYSQAIQTTTKEYYDWKAAVEQTRKELELQFKVYEENLLLDNFSSVNKNVDQVFETLKKLTELQRSYLSDNAVNTKKQFDKIKELNEVELNDLGLTLNDRLEIQKKYYDAAEALRQFDLENHQKYAEGVKAVNDNLVESAFDSFNNVSDSVGSLANTFQTSLQEMLEAQIEEGKISKQEAEKKKKTLESLEKIQLATAIAGIVADMASGIGGVWKSYGAELALNAETAAAAGPAAVAVKAALDAKSLASAILKTTGLAAKGVAGVAAAAGKSASNLKNIAEIGNDAGNSGGSGTPQVIDSTPYSYSRQVQTDVEREELLNTPIYVRVTDIDNVQRRVRVTENESSF